MYRNGDNVLTQKSLDVGLTESKEMVLCLRGRIVYARFTTFVTGNSQPYFMQKYGKQKAMLAVSNDWKRNDSTGIRERRGWPSANGCRERCGFAA